MRIITPQDAAFNPSGSSNGFSVAATFELNETVNADFGPTLTNLYNQNVDGNFATSLFLQTTAVAGAGTLTVTMVQSGGVGTIITTSCDLSVDGLTNLGGVGTQSQFSGAVISAGGIWQISRQVAGLAAGPASYKIKAVVYLLV